MCILFFVVILIKSQLFVAALLSPAFSKKSGGTLFSAFRSAWCVVRGSGFLVGTLSPQLLPQFLANPFETLQGLLR